ncbi:DoxX family protein [Actinomadura hibisca]|uniref:DoxX family protein n=1 Tax=Actinomadura hibisca TaxID=68565 RepID=UPI00082C3CCF|nr:DoxX family protein [Actinomadura hibisca]
MATERSRAVQIVVWVLQILLALMFLSAGVQKLVGTEPMTDMFDEIGVGQWLRYVIGFLEVAAAVGLCVPLLAAAAAGGVVLLMIGAVVTSVAVLDENPLVPLVVGVVAAIVLALRRAELTRLPARLGTR